MKKRWTKPGEEAPIGALRRSQLITTFGAGAMIDLVDRSAMVAGLDYWHYEGNQRPTINEPRLAARLVSQFKQHGILLNPMATLSPPPDCDDDSPSPRAGLQVVEFPRWMVCQGCSAMVQASNSLTQKDGRYMHPCASGKPSVLVPVRFVVVCPNGHLDEFPWVDFVHFGKDTECKSHALTLREDAGAELYDVRVTCQACGSFKSMGEGQQLAVWFKCPGARPWLGRTPDVPERGCEAAPSMRVRTSSSTYFAQVQSALSIPNTAARLEKLVRKHLATLGETSREGLASLIKLVPPVRNDLKSYDVDTVWAVLEAIRRNETPLPPPLRQAEFAYVQEVAYEKGGEGPTDEEAEAKFFGRRHAPVEPLPRGLERVVLIRELREVRAQVGFTRLAPLESDLDGDATLTVRSAALGHMTDWLPAIEDHGEGLWLQLDPAMVATWEARPEVRRREAELRAGWDREFADNPNLPFFGARYYMLHALSHLLIQAIALECGYGASSLRERIYCSNPGATTSMAAILLSTTTPGSEGTLGGLVAQGKRVGEHLARALELGRLCSNDPVCATHKPADLAERHLEGAACHGCLYLAEVSCERMNRMLDRAWWSP
jgi:hypothetical protein